MATTREPASVSRNANPSNSGETANTPNPTKNSDEKGTINNGKTGTNEVITPVETTTPRREDTTCGNCLECLECCACCLAICECVMICVKCFT